MSKRALIFGITGQDGSYLAEFLMDKGYEVIGVARIHSQGITRDNLSFALAAQMENGQLAIVNGDLCDEASIRHIVSQVQPDEVYNLAALSFVGSSWRMLDSVMDTNAMGAVRVFRAVQELAPQAKVYQASSSEMFGNGLPPLDEGSPMRPVSPYGISKLTAHLMAHVFRLSHGVFVACGICFNHESTRRGPMFVSRKIAMGVAAIAAGLADVLTLGDLEPSRDWGYAPDYVRAMWLMLQQDVPDDFVIATGHSHTVADFVQSAFRHVGITEWRPYIREDPTLKRPVDVRRLVGSARKAERVLGWRPETGWEQMVAKMVEAEQIVLSGGEST